MMDRRVLTDSAAVAAYSADLLARRIRACVAQRGRCRLAVSGGSTPAAMFDALVHADVPWRSVEIHQVDERVAPSGSSDRNATQLEDHLLGPLRAEGRGPRRSDVHLLPVEAFDLGRAVRRAARRLDDLAPFDLVHLGLGDDGHTASWPPGVDVPDESALAVVGAFNGLVRVTMTVRAVNTARRRVVVVSGASKAPAVARWIAGDRSVPISRVHRTGTIVILDEAAAGSVASWTRST
jgi:6-phosphogluconolactonase